jgi:hypothetical protein
LSVLARRAERARRRGRLVPLALALLLHTAPVLPGAAAQGAAPAPPQRPAGEERPPLYRTVLPPPATLDYELRPALGQRQPDLAAAGRALHAAARGQHRRPARAGAGQPWGG